MDVKETSTEKNFYSIHHKLRTNLHTTNTWLRGEIKKFLEQFNVTQQQFNVMEVLYNNSPVPLSTKAITETMIDRYADTSRVVDRLNKKDLVVKKSSKNDKRLVEVKLSAKGEDLYKKIKAGLFDLDRITSRISNEKVELLNKLLDELRENRP
jgi:DNA-binding MarR family transcriptional regulator